MKKRVSLILIIILFVSSYGASYRGRLIAEGEKITIDFKEMEISDVIRVISRKFDLNLIAGNDVTGKVTVSFIDVAVDDALEMILFVNGYTYIREGEIIRVESIKKIKEKYKKNVVIKSKIIHKTFDVKNQSASEMKKKIGSILESGEKIVVDDESKKLVIFASKSRMNILEDVLIEFDVEKEEVEKIAKDKFYTYRLNYMKVAEMAELAEELETITGVKTIINTNRKSVMFKGSSEAIEESLLILRELDSPPRQVTIEAKIIELSLDNGSETGINWKYSGDIGGKAGQTLDLDIGKKDVLNGSNDGVDMKFGTIPFSNMEFYLSYLLNETGANLLSSPNITTIDGETAKIHIGESYRYRNNINTESEGDDASTEDDLIEVVIGITLEVTPYLDSNGKIKLDINQTIDDIKGYTSDNLPITSSREAKTKVILNSSETLIIGGLIKEDEIDVETKVPILGDIPLLGELFKSKKRVSKKSNLVIFITANIVEESDAIYLDGTETREELFDKQRADIEKE